MSGIVGQHIGKYRVTQQIGRGGMGTVYCAVDETLHRDVAIKALNAGLDDPTVGRRFRAEAITVARLNHPGIATIYELVQHDGQWLMVMEFVRGETVEKALVEQGPLTLPRAAEVIMQVLAALAHAHSLGVVHRDLKPANMMLTAGGGVKIMDFGIARVAGAEQLTSAGFMMGTPAYMAPEQVLGGEIDARSDLYAVGIVLFQMVTGALPFKGNTAVQVAQARVNETPTPLAAVAADLPPWIGQVIDIALSRVPDKRFQSAMLFREAIRRGLAGMPIDAPTPPVPVSLTMGGGGVTPEAMPTVAPGALRIVKGGSGGPGPRATPPPATAARTSALSDVAPVASPAVVESVAPPRSVSPALTAGAAVLVLVVALGGWWLTRPTAVADPAPAAPAETSAAPAPVDNAGAVADVGAETPGAAPAVGPATPTAPLPPPSPSPAPTPAAARGVVPPDAGAPTAATSGLSRGRGAGPVVPAPAPAVVPAAPAPALFRGVRALIVTDRRAREQPAVLAFADGSVTLFDDGGLRPLASMPFSQVTAAAYTRDRNPRWYPTLAGPPIDVDMPGGLFRGDRHWLALQSRDAYLLVRMNDGDWRQITGAVTRFLGLEVTELRP